ncbi:MULTISPECIES: MCP four helix bundle domain-containing protein [unclassified Pedobacter]|uniref:MCP four helix bundle domain-containing protein n=1 Tax=unclassified Pedobacter TaxID=2628915 RepID=UPI001E28BCE1|nr:MULTISPECIES: MCP four helix bundle domain-containing protein [unclassified Pedobacter]
MKFAFSLKNKIKIAFLLFCIMCCTLLIRFLEDKSVKKINESFISMYKDRLVPATDLYFIAEQLHQKNALLQNILNNDSQLNSGLTQIRQLNSNIDSVINKYELTVLVKQEKSFLTELKKALMVQNNVESKICLAQPAEGLALYTATGRNSFNQSLNKLSSLIKIQTEVGDELINDSKIFVSGTKVYSTFQVILAIAIGALIVGIVSASNAVKVQQEKYNLN